MRYDDDEDFTTIGIDQVGTDLYNIVTAAQALSTSNLTRLLEYFRQAVRRIETMLEERKRKVLEPIKPSSDNTVQQANIYEEKAFEIMRQLNDKTIFTEGAEKAFDSEKE